MGESIQKVKTFYRLEINVYDGYPVDLDYAIDMAEKAFTIASFNDHHAARMAVDTCYGTVVEISFRSAFTHFEVIDNLQTLLATHPEIYSFHLWYQFPFDIAPGYAVLERNAGLTTYDAEITWKRN